MTDLDLLIIGSGSGNTILTEDYEGWHVGIAEGGTFGGTCLNVGCIPSKMLVLPADRIVEAADSARLGVHFDPPRVDWPAIRDRVFGRIDPIAAGGRDYRRSQSGVDLLEGHARFTPTGTVRIDDTEVRADQVVVATGARAYIPPIEGLASSGFHTSDTIMRIESLPEHLVVLGGGYIAAEMSHVFAALGCRVSVLHRGDTLLRHEDHDVATRFTEAFGRRVHVHLNAEVSAVRGDPGDLEIHYDQIDAAGRAFSGSLPADALLVCTGRIPNADDLGLEHTVVRRSPGGQIVTDETLRTAQPGVWAIGDVRSPLQLKHVANHEARVVSHNLLHPEDLRSIDERYVPHAVFSEPQVASVGLREVDLDASGAPYNVGRRDYAGVAYGWALADEVGFAKVLVEPVTNRILGGHVIGPQAATLVQQLTAAMQFDVDAERLARGQLWCHPALSEVLENALFDALG